MQSSMSANVLLPSLCFIALLASVIFTGFAEEERAIYLVLMEGDPVAFNGGSPSSRLDLHRWEKEPVLLFCWLQKELVFLRCGFHA